MLLYFKLIYKSAKNKLLAEGSFNKYIFTSYYCKAPSTGELHGLGGSSLNQIFGRKVTIDTR